MHLYQKLIPGRSHLHLHQLLKRQSQTTLKKGLLNAKPAAARWMSRQRNLVSSDLEERLEVRLEVELRVKVEVHVGAIGGVNVTLVML